jgi:protein involved in polysaccharide export with SLBB domain
MLGRLGLLGSLPLAVVVMFLAGCSCSEAEQIQKEMISRQDLWTHVGKHTAREYRCAPPDVLSIQVRGVQELSGNQRIRPDGRIVMGIFGEVHVSGLTPIEMGEKLEKFLSRYYRDVEVAVNIIGYESKDVYLFGMVNRGQGRMPYTGQETVLEVIARAGGITNLAAPHYVKLIRPNPFKGNQPVEYQVDLCEIVLGGNHRSNIMVKPNDQIYVPPTPTGAFGIFMERLFYPLRPVFSAVMAADSAADAWDNFGDRD